MVSVGVGVGVVIGLLVCFGCERRKKECVRDNDVRRYAEGLRILHSHTRASEIAGYARRSSRSCCHCFPWCSSSLDSCSVSPILSHHCHFIFIYFYFYYCYRFLVLCLQLVDFIFEKEGRIFFFFSSRN